MHEPVLLRAVIELLQPAGGAGAECCLVDATIGEGGHAEAFLSDFPGLALYGVDRDAEILRRAEARLARFSGRMRLFHLRFAEFFRRYDELVPRRPERILFDLGVSLFHYTSSGRGFSFGRDEPLDMRLDADSAVTAGEIVNSASEDELERILREYGEEPSARRIARAIVRERSRTPLRRSAQLAELIRRVVPPEARRARVHPATRSFQALRIAVNGELEELEHGLEAAFAVLKLGGRLGVISFHSLEDRIVKRFFQERGKACTCPPDWPICQCGGRKRLAVLTRKPVTADEAERAANPSARSAKLRVVEKL